MQTIALTNQKGGTGKTATAAALAHAAAARDKRVLCVDLDPQGNFTYTIGADASGAGALELLNGEDPAGIIQHLTNNIDMIPANWNLAAITSGPGSARRLQKALEPIKKMAVYDYIFIDTPPTAGELQFNAMQAASGIIIPLLADGYNVQSLYQTAATAEQIRKTNKALKILGIVFTQYDQRSTIAKQMRQMIGEAADKLNIPVLAEIRAAVCVKEAAALQRSLFDYAPRSKPAEDYMYLFDQINR